MQILKLLAEEDKVFTEWIEKKTSKYISHDMQNEILELLANSILREVTTKIRNSNFYALMMDETRDVSNKEQLVLGLRWVEWLENEIAIHEDFIGNFLQTLSKVFVLYILLLKNLAINFRKNNPFENSWKLNPDLSLKLETQYSFSNS